MFFNLRIYINYNVNIIFYYLILCTSGTKQYLGSLNL